MRSQRSGEVNSAYKASELSHGSSCEFTEASEARTVRTTEIKKLMTLLLAYHTRLIENLTCELMSVLRCLGELLFELRVV